MTILSTTVFQRMCTVNPAVRSALRPCSHRLVSADSSPLMVQGQLELDIVFPGLCCKILFVVANIGSDGLLGTEALQSYLPHQLDLRTGQLWAEGCSSSVLIVNPNAEVVVLPGLTLIGKLVPVAAISVTIEDTGPPKDGPVALPEYLEDIVKGSHPSLGDAGRRLLRDLLFRYRHVFPAPGEPVTGRTTTVQHDIITTDARPVRCSPRRLAPGRTQKRTDMCEGNARWGAN